MTKTLRVRDYLGHILKRNTIQVDLPDLHARIAKLSAAFPERLP